MNKISDEKTISEYKRFIKAKNPRPKAGTLKKEIDAYGIRGYGSGIKPC